MRDKGFTLIEMIIVIAIMTILMYIGLMSFQSITLKTRVENDTKRIYGVDTMARQLTFACKDVLELKFENDNVTSYDGSGTRILELTSELESDFSMSDNITFRGGFIATGGLIKSTNTANANATYDCIEFAKTRIRMGRMESGVCKTK